MNRVSKSDFNHFPSRGSKSEKATVTNVTEDIQDQDETEEFEGERRTQSDCTSVQVFLFSLPLAQFLTTALELNAEANSFIEDEWHSPAWKFTRLCKGHPNLEGLDAGTAWLRVRTHLRKLARDGMEVWEQLGADEDETGLDFTYSWEKIRIHPAKDILTDAIDRAGRIALRPPVDRGQTFAQFVSIVGHLQKIRGSEPILVPVEVFGNALGCSKMTISRMIHFAVADGLLEIMENHDYSRHKARRYRFAVERYPSL